MNGRVHAGPKSSTFESVYDLNISMLVFHVSGAFNLTSNSYDFQTITSTYSNVSSDFSDVFFVLVCYFSGDIGMDINIWCVFVCVFRSFAFIFRNICRKESKSFL